MGTIVLDRLTKVFADGTVAVDALSLDVAPGEFLVLLGPTGCGKSTVLRLVAGLEEPTSGQVILDGRRIDRLHTRDRNVAMVFQDFALYPHLTVADNIAFPLRVSSVAEAEKAARVREVVEVLDIGDLLRKLPGQLSGGQRQRVAMARAVVRRPAAFLLDEPMSNLDAHLREDLRAEIVALTRRFGVTTLYVTHDRTEALTMGDRVAVLRRGQLQQLGAPTDVYAEPVNLFVAAFLGPGQTSLLQAAVYAEDAGSVVIDLGAQVLRLPAGDPRAATLATHHAARVVVGVRADALSIVPDGVLRGTVRLVEDLGHEAVVHVDTGAVPVAPATTQLDLPDPDVDLSRVIGRERPRPGGFRQAWSRIVPHQQPPEPPATARTEYGFYPRYEAAEQGRDNRGDLLLRVTRPAPVPRPGEPVALAVDLDRLYVFDGAGARLV